MTTTWKGFINASVSAISFGLIPLFTVPVLASGMPATSVLVYHYAAGCAVMLVLLMAGRTRMSLRFGDSLRILLLSLLYAVSSVALIESYNHLASGIATTLLFSYPVWTLLLSVVFLHERLSAMTTLAIVVAVAGVSCLSGAFDGGGLQSLTGALLATASGLCYAVYMVPFPRMRIRRMPSLKVTFYIFFFTMMLMMLYALFVEGRIRPVGSMPNLVNLVLLGLLPTALSNVTLIFSLKQISSTTAAILGAFEPMTAMGVGILVFGEPFTLPVVLGFALILVSVLILVLCKKGVK